MFNGRFEVGDQELKTVVLAFARQHNCAPSLQQLIPKFIEVIDTQLADFLEGGKYGDPRPELVDQLLHCPLTNLLGERMFGDLDFDIQKRRHASNHHR